MTIVKEKMQRIPAAYIIVQRIGKYIFSLTSFIDAINFPHVINETNFVTILRKLSIVLNYLSFTQLLEIYYFSNVVFGGIG